MDRKENFGWKINVQRNFLEIENEPHLVIREVYREDLDCP